MITGNIKRRLIALLMVLICIIAAVRCSSSTSQSPFNPENGHPAGWAAPASHGAFAKSTQGFETCRSCHGADFSGGVAGRACYSCHGGKGPHPTSWVTGTYTHTTTYQDNAPVCALCHLNGSNSPITPPSPAAVTAPGCFNSTLCHGAVGHPAGWSDPAQHGPAAKAAPSAIGGFSYCESCHGPDFAGGAANTSCFTCHGGSGPHPTSWITGTYTHTNTDTGNASVCALCHLNGAHSPIAPPSPAAAAGTAPGCFNSTLCHGTPACGTCHAIPPNGTVAPNIAGNHGDHMSVNTTIACSTCHLNAGSGTALHQNGVVDVILDPAYNAKSGGASYSDAAKTCSNIGCHGSSRTQTATQASSGLSTPGPTPAWGTGTITVNTQCSACHVLGTGAGLPENNSYYSGQHYRHVYGGASGAFPAPKCTVCHDVTKLAVVHFTSLTAAINETTAASTLTGAINFSGGTCNPGAGGLTGCHSTESW